MPMILDNDEDSYFDEHEMNDIRRGKGLKNDIKFIEIYICIMEMEFLMYLMMLVLGY